MNIDWENISILDRRKLINEAYRREGDTPKPLVEFWIADNHFFARDENGKKYVFKVRGFGKTYPRNIQPNKDGSITIPADTIEMSLTASWEPVHY